MITIEPPIYRIRGVTVFRDHANPDLHYYLPGAPRLARSGDAAAFTLFKFRRDLTDNPALDPTRARGAGLAQFEVEIPPANVAALTAEVASLSGRSSASVSPVLFRSAEVRALVAHSSQDKLVEDLVETHLAPLVVPHRAAFALALTAEGATLFEQAARGGQLPVGVVYEMRFLALTPALHARVTMDYERIYDHFSASVGFTYYVSVRLDLDLTWLIEHDFVKIQITSFTDDEDQKRQQQMVMALVKARIERDFFRSGLPPKPQAGAGDALGSMLGSLGGGGDISSTSAYFVLKAKLEVVRERKSFELLYDGRTAVELTHTAPAFLSTLIADVASPTIREIDLDDPFFSSLAVRVASVIDFEAMADLKAAIVSVAHGDFRQSYPFSPQETGPYRFEVPLIDPRRDEYRWEAEYHFDPDLGSGPPVVKAGPYTSRSRSLLLDPFAHFRYLRLRVLRGPVDPSLVPRLRVQLTVRDDDGVRARTEVRLDAERSDVVWRLHLPMAFSTLRVRARADWEDPQGIVHEGEEEEVRGDSYVALGPYRDLMKVSVQPAVDWRAATQLRVELRYEDGAHVVDRRVSFLAAPGNVPQDVEFPLLDRTRRRFRWRQILILTNGTVEETDWAESDQTLLVVGQPPPAGREVRVVWVGAPGNALGLRVDFWVSAPSGEEETVGTFLRAGETEKTVSLPPGAEGRLSYRYEAKRLTPEGEETVRLGEGQSNLLVIQT